MTTLPCWRKLFQESPEKIIQSMPRFQSPDFLVMDRLMEDTMLIQKPNAKCSTFVLLMELEVLPNIVSCVPMEPSSTRTTSSVTGGSTLTVLKLRVFTASMTNLQQKERLLQPLLHREATLLQTQLQLEDMMLQLESLRTPRLPMVRLPVTPEMDEDQKSPSQSQATPEDQEEETEDKVKPYRLQSPILADGSIVPCNPELVKLFILSMAVVVKTLNEFRASEYKSKHRLWYSL